MRKIEQKLDEQKLDEPLLLCEEKISSDEDDDLEEFPVGETDRYNFFCSVWCAYMFLFVGLFCASYFVLQQVYKYYKAGGLPAVQASYITAAWFVLIAVPISMYEIIQHLKNYRIPYLQRHVVRILWMVPIYAIESWFSLFWHEKAQIIEAFREAYESFVIYSFMHFLLLFVGRRDGRRGEERIRRVLKRKPSNRGKHLFPCCFLPRWRLGRAFLFNCSFGVLQYVFAKLFTTFAAIIFVQLKVYGEGQWWNFRVAYPYLAMINNLSQCWAVYCLILFYHVCHEELEPMRPLGKFIAIKAVVFFSFWQGVVIGFLTSYGYLESLAIHLHIPWEKHDVSHGLQDFIICVEMLIYAILHRFVFTYKDFRRCGSIESALLKGGRASKRRRRKMEEDGVEDGKTQTIEMEANELSFDRKEDDEEEGNHSFYDSFWSEASRLSSFRWRGSRKEEVGVMSALWDAIVPSDVLTESRMTVVHSNATFSDAFRGRQRPSIDYDGRKLEKRVGAVKEKRGEEGKKDCK